MTTGKNRQRRRGTAGWQKKGMLLAMAGTLSAVSLGGQAVASASAVPRTQAVLQVIVRAVPGQLAKAERSVELAHGVLKSPLGIINGFVADVPSGSAAALSSAPGVANVSPDSAVHMLSVNPSLGYDPTGDYGSLYSTEQAIGAPSAWGQNITGAGVDVALLDTGVSPVPGLDEPGKLVNGPDLSFDSQSPSTQYLDGFGHGTHMAGIIAGRDDSANASSYSSPSTFVGVAPDARIVNVKVGSATGDSDVSQILAGINWVVENAHSNGLNIKVLNLSLGTSSLQPYTLDPLDYATEVAWKHGITVVVAAGNDGTSSSQLADPANDPFVISVGALDLSSGKATKSAVATFNNNGTPARHVDLLAPGTHILSLRDPGSVIDQSFPSAEVGTRFFRGSGTSQATAVVSGAVALLAQEYPSATPDQLKALLIGTAKSIKKTDVTSQGSGLIQLSQAIKRNLPDAASSAQTSTPSTGLGSLEQARGGSDLTDNGATLTGEQDIFGQPWSAATWAAASAAGTTWSGGTWNSSTWIGTWPNLWAGQTLATDTSGAATTSSLHWSSLHWSSLHWSGVDWSSLHWSSLHWSSLHWSGSGWQ